MLPQGACGEVCDGEGPGLWFEVGVGVGVGARIGTVGDCRQEHWH